MCASFFCVYLSFVFFDFCIACILSKSVHSLLPYQNHVISITIEQSDKLNWHRFDQMKFMGFYSEVEQIEFIAAAGSLFQHYNQLNTMRYRSVVDESIHSACRKRKQSFMDIPLVLFYFFHFRNDLKTFLVHGGEMRGNGQWGWKRGSMTHKHTHLYAWVWRCACACMQKEKNQKLAIADYVTIPCATDDYDNTKCVLCKQVYSPLKLQKHRIPFFIGHMNGNFVPFINIGYHLRAVRSQ